MARRPTKTSVIAERKRAEEDAEWFAGLNEADAAEAAKRVAGLQGETTDAADGDPPTEPVVALVKLSDNGTDDTIGANVTTLAHLAELDHWANAYAYQVKTVAALAGLLAEATAQLGDREAKRLVNPELVAKIHRQVDGWAIQCGVENARGGGS